MSFSDGVENNFLSTIDTDLKAYFLGWIATEIRESFERTEEPISLKLDEPNVSKELCIDTLHKSVSPYVPIIAKYTYTNIDNKSTCLPTIIINSKPVEETICLHLGLCRGKYEGQSVVKFPNFTCDSITWSFIRGVFDGVGKIKCHKTCDTPECSIQSQSIELLQGIANFSKIPCILQDNRLTFSGTNCMDFLDKLYQKSTKNLRLSDNYKLFIDWASWRCLLPNPGTVCKLPLCQVYKTHKDAVFPSKTKMTDVGYDLTVIKVEKQWYNKITLYDTGIKIRMQHGYYAEIVPRSSLVKSGYVLANSIGIIDRNYNGNLFIALAKVDDSAPDIELPFRCCQLVFKQQINMDMVEVDNEFDETTRGEGGFGSTGA